MTTNVTPPERSFAEVEFSEKVDLLFDKQCWLKVLYGGRGGIKSWSIAQYLLITAYSRQFRVLCCRELMKSIAESVHELLELQIGRLDLKPWFRIEKAHIYGPHGSEFAFTGLRDAHNLKSFEDFDCAWIEEGANVSKRSFDMLFPTIRKEGSQIIVSFNPELDTDECYKRFVLKPPPGARVVKTSWRDNKWLSDRLLTQIHHMRDTAPDDFLNIYEGHPKVVLDGAIYAHELRTATAAGRIRSVPYDPALPVHTFWDLGIADQTSIWFVQSGLFEYRFIDFLQDRNRALPWYLAELQKKGYVYGWHHLPHDGKRRDLGTGKSIEHHMHAAGFKTKIVPDIGLANGLNAARLLFQKAYFDEVQCADGLNALRRYRWQKNPDTGIYSSQPLHDDNSNGADAYRMAAVGLTQPQREKAVQRQRFKAQVGVWT